METVIDPWRKSSRSGGSNGGCVEVARTDDDTILIRDTTNRAAGHIGVTAAAWRDLVKQIKTANLPDRTLVRHQLSGRGSSISGSIPGAGRVPVPLGGTGCRAVLW